MDLGEIEREGSGPLVGWRGWLVDWPAVRGSFAPRLVGPVLEEPWPRGVSDARCRAGPPHEAPERSCRCGLYAFSDPDPVVLELGRPHLSWAPRAFGRVRGWGKAVLHERGWRSRHAQVEVLFLCSQGRPDLAAQLETWYEAPALVVRPEL